MATSLSQTIPEMRKAYIFRKLNDIAALRECTVLTVEVSRTVLDDGLDVLVRWLGASPGLVMSSKFHFSEPIDDDEMVDTIAVGIRMGR